MPVHIWAFLVAAWCSQLGVRSSPPVNPQDPHNCSQYATCEDCAAKFNRNGNCGWCAHGSDGGGVCQSMHAAEVSIPGCPSDFWNKACCAAYKDCDTCSTHVGSCQWCDGGSKVNGGKCIPFSGARSPTLGGCDDGFYQHACCRKFRTCNACKSGGFSCGWCTKASSINPGQCLPAVGGMQPACGGCSDGDWDRYQSCPDDVPCGKHCFNQQPGKEGCDIALVDNRTGRTVGKCTKCKIGYWGSTCDKPCDKNCLVGCDKDSGECFGCTDGRCGFSCQDTCTAGWNICKSCDQGCANCTECYKGTYDPSSRCGKTCGQCADFNCDDQSGKCSGKCLLGWSGSSCDQPCTTSCQSPKVCYNGECICGPGYTSGLLGTCTSQGSVSCETCTRLVETAKTLTEIAKKYKTIEEAQEALKTISCFFLPGPAAIGCAAIITTETLGVFIVSQVTDKLLTEGFCHSMGYCSADSELELSI
eukprot:TRINITY_DN106541_c0_g1_i1.p1 TRINITY_DN106541_c0_g1~~TRINITY_DN106541_c0_g1_i1.p1  ORF type:complete len:474 (+),score=41.91 TRINITY_DN106541_c0_g1_i1:59-1480(+)